MVHPPGSFVERTLRHRYALFPDTQRSDMKNDDTIPSASSTTCCCTHCSCRRGPRCCRPVRMRFAAQRSPFCLSCHGEGNNLVRAVVDRAGKHLTIAKRAAGRLLPWWQLRRTLPRRESASWSPPPRIAVNKLSVRRHASTDVMQLAKEGGGSSPSLMILRRV